MCRIIIFIIAILISGASMACSCIKYPENIKSAVKKSYKLSDSVLIGKVESVTTVKIPTSFTKDSQIYEAEGEIAEFSVIKSWKGSHTKQIYIKAITECCMCGIPFKKGEQYLLYASGPNKEGYYEAGLCSRTKQIDEAKDDIEILTKMPNKALKDAP